MPTLILIVVFIYVLTIAASVVVPLVAGSALVWLGYQVYLIVYFRSSRFLSIKEDLQGYIEDCNAMNSHISTLKSVYPDAGNLNHGSSVLSDHSTYNYKRPAWNREINRKWTHECSAAVVRSSASQPFKYLCKYFNISVTEDTVEQLEQALNCFAAAEEGKTLLMKNREHVLEAAYESVPWLVRRLSIDRVTSELGFEPVDLSDLYFPVYSFFYSSPAGKSSFSNDIKLDVLELQLFIRYLAELVKFKKSAAGQRALMTTYLREKIKDRDGHACQKCGLSTEDEPNLLLEIDHIVPVSKGGLTTEANLQTLCWRCNRQKGSKLL